MQPANISGLRFERLLRGLSQYELAMRARVPQSLISLFERHFAEPNERQARRLSRVLGRKPEELFPESEAVR
jgi:transcriptional regulator with XRE-family HTH domain